MRNWSEYEPHEKRLFWWLMLLFGVGNMVFVNVLANVFGMGMLGLPVGVGVSGLLTLALFLGLREFRSSSIPPH